LTKEETLEAIIAGAKANGSWDKKYPDDKKAQPAQEPVQVSPLEFVTMILEKEHLIGNPIIWAQWPNKEKNT